jgi:hypothetical protein
MIETTLEVALELWDYTNRNKILVDKRQLGDDDQDSDYWEYCYGDSPWLLRPSHASFGEYDYLFKGFRKVRGANRDTLVKIELIDYTKQIATMKAAQKEQQALVTKLLPGVLEAE